MKETSDKHTLLIGHIIWDLQKIDISYWHAHILRLPSSKPASEMGVTKESAGLGAVHGLGCCVGVGLLTLRCKLLLAVKALSADVSGEEASSEKGAVFVRSYLSTCDLERSDVSFADSDFLHSQANLVNDTAEFMPENVSLLQLDDDPCR